MDEVIQEVLRDLLEEQLDRVLETVLKEIAGLTVQVSLLQGVLNSAGPANVGSGGDLAELITAATARGGRFF
ncbi:MAG: hypothetical protein AAGG45_08125 [Pseudomonadota bacterium]